MRCSLTLWTLAHDHLTTKSLLWERQIVESPECERYGEAMEMGLHAIRDCRLTRKMWELILPDRQWKEFWDTHSPKKWILLKLSHSLAGAAKWRKLEVHLPTGCT